MITCNVLGRKGQFGNQLFQYAALYAIARRLGYSFGVPYSNRSEDRHQHFALPDVFPNLSAQDSRQATGQTGFYERVHYAYDERTERLSDNTDICGLFLTYQYFHEFRTDLLQEFVPSTDRVARVTNFLRTLGDRPTVFMHVRRTDALTNAGLFSPDADYYCQAAAMFSTAQIVVLSDDYPWCREHLGNDLIYSPFTDKFDDFELMRQADHGIISNSTFSWWGAWLGAPSRTIVAPAVWYAGKYKSRSADLNIIWPSWVQLDHSGEFS
jgi:hypothetical protein